MYAGVIISDKSLEFGAQWAKPGSSRQKMNELRFLATFLNLIPLFVSKNVLAPISQNKKLRRSLDED